MSWLYYMHASNNFRFIILNPTQRSSKSDPRFLPEKQRQERASTPMHRLPQCHLENPRLSAKTHIKWINMIPHCHHGYSYARLAPSVLKSIKVFNPIVVKPQRSKLNSSQQDREEKKQYDQTILTKLAVHQERAKSRTRERDQIHSYWYIPSAPRENYFRLFRVFSTFL